MQHSLRLDQRLHVLRDEVRIMTQDKERGEQVWRERLQRCQRQLKAKEEEMSRQSEYFENFKTQLQNKLSLAQDREHTLKNRIYTLEKQLLDMTVSAATGIATVSAVRITAGTVTQWEEHRLPPMRGEGEGEEEKKEERRRQWQPSVENETEEEEKEMQGGRIKDKLSHEARLRGLILSLQEDLKVLLEREEEGENERRGLMGQLQEALENSHFLGCKMEEMKAKVHQLKLSEHSLVEEMEALTEENHRLSQILQDPANQTASQSSTVPGSNTLSYTTAMGHSSGSTGKVHILSDDQTLQLLSSEVQSVLHQVTAELLQNDTKDCASSPTPTKIFHFGCKKNPNLQSLSLTTETVDEFKLGTWCSRGILDLEKCPSEESNALQEAYRRLGQGLGENLEVLQDQCLDVTLEDTQQEWTERTQLWEEKDKEAEQGSSREKFPQISTLPTRDGAEDNSSLLPEAQDDLVQALNQENRALAQRIQECLAHIELREEETRKEQTQLRGHISKLEVDGVRLAQEKQDQECLITELTKKTEDDLNTIMELQQRLEDSKQLFEESPKQSECTTAAAGHFQLSKQEECVDSLVESIVKEEKPHLMSSHQPDELSAPSASGSQHDNHDDLLQNRQSSLYVGSLTDQEVQLNKSVQSLNMDKKELSDCINALREQQREVALSVQSQTEVKQQLTRTVWRLKEEKDGITQSLTVLKQEREQLTRTVCGLKDEREQIMKTISGLKEQREFLSALERDKNKLLMERDQIMQSLQGSQTESDHLSQAVLRLKQERDDLTNSLKCLKEQRDKQQSSHTSQDACDQLITSEKREDKESIERSIRCLKQEEMQIKLLLHGLREERNSLQASLPSQKQTEGRIQKQHLLDPNDAITAKKTQTLVGTEATQTESSAQDQSDLMRESEALRAELKKSQDELDKSNADVQRLYSELCQSEAGREDAERKAAQAADQMESSLADVADQMEDIRKENDSLTTQVKELQGKLTCLVREKTNAVSLKAQIEEQYNILTAQLKAKTVALEELNSQYMALKQGQDSKADLRAQLSSLRTCYNDIRAKYDALMKKRSPNDQEIAPLKAKLSCLVLKCQERNSLLVQMTKAMQKRGCVDSTLTQQVEHLLSDAALQDYSHAFTSRSNGNTQGHTPSFTSGFVSKFQDHSGGFKPDLTCSTMSPLVRQQQPNGFTSDSEEKCGELKSENMISLLTTESTTKSKKCWSEVQSASTGTLKKNANSRVPTSPVQEHASVPESPSPDVPDLRESTIPNTAQVSPSASGPNTFGLYCSDMKGKSSPHKTGLDASSWSPTPPSSPVSPSRRLSSPEKIINLHQQLQKTLISSYQAPLSRGRGQQPKKSLSFSAPADLRSASPTKQSLSSSLPHTNSVPVTAAVIQAKHTPTATNKPTTLVDAVASRSANVTFSPNMFTNGHFKSDTPKTTSFSLSSTFLSAATTACTAKLTTSSGTNTAVSHLKCSGTNPKTTASETTASNITTAPKAYHFNMPSKTNGAAAANDGLVSTASSTPPAHCSPETFNKWARKSTAALEKPRTARPKPEAPAEVRTVEVIKTVGQSSLLIGWERPPLDELGCSNGTFVYGYRVFVGADFHKSVMSSACTKCILENVDLSVPVNISVQTLGSNGLSSSFVHTTYRTTVTHHS